MHDFQSEQTCDFELLGLTFDVQTYSQCVRGYLNPFTYFYDFYFFYLNFYSFKFKIKLNKY